MAFGFAPGTRPGRAEIVRVAHRSGAFTVTHDPGGQEDWIEVLRTGLGFEIAGLAPAPAARPPIIKHRIGPDEGTAAEFGEPLLLRPGPHLAGGEAMLPVVQGCIALALSLMTGMEPQSVCWLPGAIRLHPPYFRTIMEDWLGGGPFPALGLTALVAAEAGLRSEGLAFFIGQELEIPATSHFDSRQDARLALRAIDALVRNGPLSAPLELTGPNEEGLRAEPLSDGKRVVLRRIPAR